MTKEKRYLPGYEGNWTREICEVCDHIIASPVHYNGCIMGSVIETSDPRDMTFVPSQYAVPIQKSAKITAFFNLHTEEKGFWSWVGDGPYEAERNSDNYIDELFDAGYNLAVQAGGRPVFELTPNPDYNDSWIIYFIGTEEDILKKLKTG